MSKLFQVTVEYTFYASADNEREACRLAQDAINDISADDYAAAAEIHHREHVPYGEWDDNSLIYGPGNDTTLGDALAELPSRFGNDHDQ